MKALSTDSFLARLLAKRQRRCAVHPGWFFYPQIALFIACIIYTVLFLQFDTSRDNLVGSNEKYHQNYLNFKKEFPEQSDLVVVIQSENIEKNRQFAERIGAKLVAETNLFTDVFYKGVYQ